MNGIKTRLGFTILTKGLSCIGGEIKLDGIICCTFNDANLIVEASIVCDPTAILRQCANFQKAL